MVHNKRKAFGLAAGSLACGVIALIIAMGSEPSSEERSYEVPTRTVAVADRCGKPARGADGEPLTITLPLLPPPPDEDRPAVTRYEDLPPLPAIELVAVAEPADPNYAANQHVKC